MNLFTDVQTEEYYADILFGSWDELVLALRAYGSGQIEKVSRAFGRTLSDLSGREAGVALLGGLGAISGGTIVEKVLLPKFEQWRARPDHYHTCSEGFDYDGGRLFHKTDVDVMELDAQRGIYALGLSAAYVGREPEQKLARALGLSRALWWAKTHVTGTANSPVYRLPLDRIVERLSYILKLPLLDATTLALRFVEAFTTDAWSLPRISLVEREPFSVSLGFEHMAFDMPYKAKWSVDGTDILCPLCRCQYADEKEQYGTFRSPVWDITVRKNGRDRLPLWEPQHITQTILLTREIADVFVGVS